MMSSSRAARSAAEAIGETVDEVRGRGRAAIGAARDIGMETFDGARDTAGRVAGSVKDTVDRNPALVIGLGIALAAVVGFAIGRMRRD